MANEIRLVYPNTGEVDITVEAYYDNAGTMTARTDSPKAMSDADIAGVYVCDVGSDWAFGDTLMFKDGSAIISTDEYLKIVGADNDTLKTISEQIDAISAAAGQPSID